MLCFLCQIMLCYVMLCYVFCVKLCYVITMCVYTCGCSTPIGFFIIVGVCDLLARCQHLPWGFLLQPPQ